MICGGDEELICCHDPLYDTVRVYNALRLAHALVKREPSMQVNIFLMADAVLADKAQQKTPDGYYNVERMLKHILSNKRCDTFVRHVHGRARHKRH